MPKIKEDHGRDDQNPNLDDGNRDQSSDVAPATQQGQTRRGVLKALGAALGGVVAYKLSTNSEGQKEKLSLLAEEAKALFEKVKGENKHEYLRTIAFSLLAQTAEIILLMVCENAGIDISKWGNGGAAFMQKFEEKSPKVTLALDTVVCPVLEEVVFRELPYRFFAKNISEGNHWKVGLPSSVIFAFMHNIIPSKKFPFHTMTDDIPIPQLAGGLLFWHLRVNKGLDHAMLAHAFQNASQNTIYNLLTEMFPPKEKPVEKNAEKPEL